MSFIRSKLGYFHTEQGRVTSFGIYGAFMATILSGHVLPHTALVYRYRDFVRLYSKGISVPVPEELDRKFKKTLEMLKIEKRFFSNYESFMASGFDLISMGSSYGRFGIHVGLPVNFTFNNVEQIDQSKILIKQESVVWESEAGQQLLNALVIPENAQHYAIAREIKLRESLKLHIDTSLAILGSILTYTVCANMNDKLKLFDKPRGVRFMGYALVAAFNTVSYFMCKDIYRNSLEERIDKELVELDPQFKEGGRLFYSHILERNKALRLLMGKDGEKTYTVLGNENIFIRNKYRPLVQRLAFFEAQDNSESSDNVSI